METIVEIVKDFLVPGSFAFLILGLTFGAVLLYLRKAGAKWGRRWLTLLAALYWLLSTPLYASALESLLADGYISLSHTEGLEAVTGIVVLGGGGTTYRASGGEVDSLSEASILRALEGVRLYEMLEDPWVFVSGGINQRDGRSSPESEALQQMMIEAGVPAKRIVLESTSSNTFEQAVNLAPMLEERSIGSFILVTSATHMRRATATFKAQGLNPIPSAAQQHSDGFLSARAFFLPNKEALEASRVAMRELMAIVYYRLAGRLTTP
jgi:uncharacterized SAM-binding protein YcdF (DUF218 family)